MNNNQIYTLEINLLTPLHIGSGEILKNNIDFWPNKNALKVFDLDAMFKKLYKENPEAFKELGQADFDLQKFIRDYKLSPKIKYFLPLKGKSFNNISSIKEVRGFIKNGLGKLYIPGSSLKGAIFTAIWANFCKQTRVMPDRNVVNRFFGSPQQSTMRSLQVVDSKPVDFDSLSLYELKLFNLIDENKAGWKDFRSRQTKRDFKQTQGIYVEAMDIDTTTYSQIALDNFLLDDTVKQMAGLKGYRFKSMEDVIDKINEHSLSFIEKEIDFLSQFGEHTSGVVNFYKELQGKIENINSMSCILRVAWGGGWKAMTGDWLRDEELEEVRKEKKLGKFFCAHCGGRIVKDKKLGRFVCQQCGSSEIEFFPVFPKTRRFIVKDNIPSLPPGWIEIRFRDKDVFYKLKATQTKTKQQPKDKERTSVRPKPKTDPEKNRKEQLKLFENSINLQQLVANINTYLQGIRNTQDKELQKEKCKILLEKAKSLPKKQRYNKALKQGKKWALALKELADELLESS